MLPPEAVSTAVGSLMTPPLSIALALALTLSAATAGAQPATPGDPAHRARLGELEQRAAALKEQIFRTKSRLTVLEETLLDPQGGAAARIVHRNQMGASFRLERATYRLDGQIIFDETGAALDDRPEIELYGDAITPGEHTLSAALTYRGDGFGVFSYLRNYVFTLRSTHTFHLDPGDRITIHAVGYEQGGVTTDLTERPAIRFEDTLGAATP